MFDIRIVRRHRKGPLGEWIQEVMQKRHVTNPQEKAPAYWVWSEWEDVLIVNEDEVE